MDGYIKKIYDMIYSPIISPYNLLENAKISNYSYVKYYKADDSLIAEMECEMDGEGKKIFYYCFDSKDFLKEIIMETSGIKETVFQREKAIEEAKREYYDAKPSYSKAT